VGALSQIIIGILINNVKRVKGYFKNVNIVEEAQLDTDEPGK
jgi:hypothetical protein